LIFNLSLSQCRFPSIWKESFIIPLFKKGNKSDISNYRGIAKLSSIPKLFEKIITCQLQHHCRSIISPCQHGFTRCRSTSTNLLEFTSLITRGFLTHHQTDVIYTDFSKAFDSVNHRILIYKLSLLGFPPNLLEWILSYLSNRTQMVCFNNKISKIINVTSGVPQGSHLGPLLFGLMINELPYVIKSSTVLMYADDVKLCLSMCLPNSYNDLQLDLYYLYTWCINMLN